VPVAASARSATTRGWHTEELPGACYGGAEQREFHRETAAARSTSSGKVRTASSLGVATLCTEDRTTVKATLWWRSAVLARPALGCSTWRTKATGLAEEAQRWSGVGRQEQLWCPALGGPWRGTVDAPDGMARLYHQRSGGGGRWCHGRHARLPRQRLVRSKRCTLAVEDSEVDDPGRLLRMMRKASSTRIIAG
jgi:hypothetical protein